MPRVLIALLCAFTVVVSACVGDGSTITADVATPAARLARAADATVATGSARTTVVATVAGLVDHDGPLVLPSVGEIDFAAGRSRLTLDIAALDPPGGATTIDQVVADGVLYVRAPALQVAPDPWAPWARIDPSDLAVSPADSGMGPLGRLATADAGAPIALLAGLDASTVEQVGGDGDVVTFRGRVDTVAAVDDGTDAAELAALEALLDQLGARHLDIEVDLDGTDRIQRIAYHHEGPTPAGPVRQTMEITYRDFGVDVDIAVPPADQVRDLASADQGPR